MKPGSYDRVNVTECGVYLPDGTLAGSVLTMNNALKNIIDATGLSLDLAWPMTSLNPARQLGLDHKKGKLVPGYDADIVVLDPHDYAVMMTMVGGEMVYEKISGMNA
jgi:N-acetylglucosamine-6-phosphate deacetylase